MPYFAYPPETTHFLTMQVFLNSLLEGALLMNRLLILFPVSPALFKGCLVIVFSNFRELISNNGRPGILVWGGAIYGQVKTIYNKINLIRYYLRDFLNHAGATTPVC